jgi:hypothetical protein
MRAKEPRFDKPNYMKLILEGIASGIRYESLKQALWANGPIYDMLRVSGPGWEMIAGQIESAYFQGGIQQALLKGLDRADSRKLIWFVDRHIQPQRWKFGIA